MLGVEVQNTCKEGPTLAHASSRPREGPSTLSLSLTHSSSLSVLVALYEEPEKPNCALDFLKHHLGATAPENPEVEALRLEVAELKEKYEVVLEENRKLKAKLAQYEPPPEEKQQQQQQQ
uniref:MYC binding protein n=1 Tax=Anolis carolinensis TaxID=28377 RepID=A0A803TUI9_ANOCA